MSNIYVCKQDGSIQCRSNPGVSPEDMKPVLAALVGEKNILSVSQKSVYVPLACDTPTGNLNVYEITKEGLEILISGFVGMGGFEICKIEEEFSSKQIKKICLEDLVGRPIRVYEEGDAITKDFRQERINFVTVNGSIMRSYFG